MAYAPAFLILLLLLLLLFWSYGRLDPALSSRTLCCPLESRIVLWKVASSSGKSRCPLEVSHCPPESCIVLQKATFVFLSSTSASCLYPVKPSPIWLLPLVLISPSLYIMDAFIQFHSLILRCWVFRVTSLLIQNHLLSIMILSWSVFFHIGADNFFFLSSHVSCVSTSNHNFAWLTTIFGTSFLLLMIFLPLI